MEKQTYNLTLADKVFQTEDAVSFSFKKPFLTSIPYNSGQYLTLHVDIDGQLHKRAYSLNSANGVDKNLTVTIKRVQGGKVSNYLIDNFEPGQKMTVEAPQGDFLFVPSKRRGRQLVLIGAGSGITPLYSILKIALEKEPLSKVKMLYFNRNADSIIFKDSIRKVYEKNPKRFKYQFMVDEDSSEYDMYQGRATVDGLEKQLDIPIAQFDNSLFYICGPEGLMQTAYDGLIKMGVPDSAIHIESFTGRFQRVEDPNPKGIAAKVIYKKKKITYEFDVKPNQTILQAAKNQNIPMMYSCCAGSCGSCVCRVSDGKVEMDGNNVLRPQETKQGYMLTCVAYPQTEKIRLQDA